MANTTLAQDLKKLKRLKAKADKSKKQSEADENEFKMFQYQVIERMKQGDGTGEEIQGLKVGNVHFVRAETLYSQIQDRSEFVKWAQENDISLIEYKERKGEVNRIVREKLDNGEPPPPGVGFYIKEYISQRAAA